jgi:hypothetical protein
MQTYSFGINCVKIFFHDEMRMFEGTTALVLLYATTSQTVLISPLHTSIVIRSFRGTTTHRARDRLLQAELWLEQTSRLFTLRAGPESNVQRCQFSFRARCGLIVTTYIE